MGAPMGVLTLLSILLPFGEAGKLKKKKKMLHRIPCSYDSACKLGFAKDLTIWKVEGGSSLLPVASGCHSGEVMPALVCSPSRQCPDTVLVVPAAAGLWDPTHHPDLTKCSTCSSCCCFRPVESKQFPLCHALGLPHASWHP